MKKERQPEPLDFFIWTIEDVSLWLEDINLGAATCNEETSSLFARNLGEPKMGNQGCSTSLFLKWAMHRKEPARTQKPDNF
ncbi:hypothetical protein Nepgr_014411 [Nepenthes gracilis]|uniref:SAM domain-containing protein n=1 Tax=Nepenthes gracilis TaxID=150966 RepID=A0AAD3XQF9_NEPGR|nr:hypothetical protein Nepgr_014411 [Nepenthes gracilis]